MKKTLRANKKSMTIKANGKALVPGNLLVKSNDVPLLIKVQDKNSSFGPYRFIPYKKDKMAMYVGYSIDYSADFDSLKVIINILNENGLVKTVWSLTSSSVDIGFTFNLLDKDHAQKNNNM